jgi:hypothetical protein
MVAPFAYITPVLQHSIAPPNKKPLFLIKPPNLFNAINKLIWIFIPAPARALSGVLWLFSQGVC